MHGRVRAANEELSFGHVGNYDVGVLLDTKGRVSRESKGSPNCI
jgi:hypothetical protein